MKALYSPKCEPVCGFIDENSIHALLNKTSMPDTGRVRKVIEKARSLEGLEISEVAVLLNCSHPLLLEEIFQAANHVKNAIYGKRLVLFAPLYISNLCKNECLYCAFRASNKSVKRRALSQEEIADEVRYLAGMGHKRVLLVAGEAYSQRGLDYIFKAIDTVYSTRVGNGEIRRINVNIAPLSVDEFRDLKACGIGTYQLFQETYHRPTYAMMHKSGPKSNYEWRLGAIERAMNGGIDDVGIGILFGLYDYGFEILALIQHIRHLESVFGVGPHTISVPRLEPAEGSTVASNPPCPISDLEFKKIVAILRLAVPYTGIIMSTRETERMRTETFALGVSQISAASRTNPGGYSSDGPSGAQFQLGDHRSLEEVITGIVRMGYVPSFCTACYRLGRTGGDFMDLAKPGLIRNFCLPNALLTFREYLEDYAGEELRAVSGEYLAEHIEEIPSAGRRKETLKRLDNIGRGDRDLYF